MERRRETETEGMKKHRKTRQRNEGPKQESVLPVLAFQQARGPRPRPCLTSVDFTQNQCYINVYMMD